MKQSLFCKIITIFILIFLYLPIIILIISSFNEARFGGIWTGFTFKWYGMLLKEPRIWEALKNSLLIGGAATIAATSLGTLAALAIHSYHSKMQKIHYSLIYIPLMIPDILMGISLLLFFVAINLSLGFFTVFIAHTTFCISYVTMVMLSKLQNFDFSIVEAAQDLGANYLTLFYKILLPLLTPAITAAALLSFTLSIDDFVITYFTAGNGVSTLPLYVYSMMKFGSLPLVNALSVVILIITFIGISITQTILQED